MRNGLGTLSKDVKADVAAQEVEQDKGDVISNNETNPTSDDKVSNESDSLVENKTVLNDVSKSEQGDNNETPVAETKPDEKPKPIVTRPQGPPSKKPLSPFAKFRQLDKQNSDSSPRTPNTPTGSRPLFKFTDPDVSQKASTIKERLLQWVQMKTKEYENISIDNFSGSWADGLAFCALIHHFLPDAFDYTALTPKNRRHNFTLAFTVAEEKAGIYPLLDVEDMVMMSKPDWKCVFTYVQAIYRRFKDED